MSLTKETARGIVKGDSDVIGEARKARDGFALKAREIMERFPIDTSFLGQSQLSDNPRAASLLHKYGL